jgi:bromodomain-containing protein 7/9
LQQSYPRSLARFAAQLGPVGWEVASKRIEKAIPHGMTFGRGWVGDDESPNTFQPPVPTSSSTAVTPPSSTAASSDQHAVDDPASANHSAGPHPRVDSQSVQNMQCGSLPQVSVDQGEQAVETKSSHNVHEWPAKHQTLKGFNAVPGANPDCSFVSFSTSFGSKLATSLPLIPIYLTRFSYVCTYSAAGREPDADTYG